MRVNWVAYNTVELKDGQMYPRVASARYRVKTMREGLKWALDHPDEAQHRALDGQGLVEATYSPAVVAGAWEAVLAPPSAAGEHPTPCSGK